MKMLLVPRKQISSQVIVFFEGSRTGPVRQVKEVLTAAPIRSGMLDSLLHVCTWISINGRTLASVSYTEYTVIYMFRVALRLG